ncbi:hypothetical protein OUZ56_009370 [Daphnia magna]|uniref:Uncharacterized protein n=1 Tax=Daphnia magna TaxID=35525 RepID=A0ABR0AFS5_9CRUS|nr:hypothetical protein OUZ56_009370 [Daphnia magna]
MEIYVTTPSRVESKWHANHSLCNHIVKCQQNLEVWPADGLADDPSFSTRCKHYMTPRSRRLLSLGRAVQPNRLGLPATGEWKLEKATLLGISSSVVSSPKLCRLHGQRLRSCDFPPKKSNILFIWVERPCFSH